MTEQKTTSPSDLRALLVNIANNPSQVHDLDLEQAARLHRELDPLGNMVSNKGEKKSYINLSIINWRDRYLRKLLTTTLVGFTYRTLEEYEPEEELAKEKTKHNIAMAKARDDKTKAKLLQDHEGRCKLIIDTTRNICRQFLNRNFEYDPDRHLRGAHVEGKEKPDINEMATQAHADKIESTLKSKPDAMFQYMRSHLMTGYQAMLETASTIATIVELLNDPTTSTEDVQGILIKKYVSLTESAKDMAAIVEPLAAADTLLSYKINPPAEAFHQFDRYFVNHYEQLKQCTQALYSERADIEFGVVIHGVHKSTEEAANYRVQHRDEFRTDVFAVETGAVCLIGPFKENRDAIEYYNKNTEMLKLMHSQLEADHKLGEDLMKKRARHAKKKNIDEVGQDEPGIKEYNKTMNAVRELGGKKVLTREEQDALAEAKKKAEAIREDIEVPEQCIQVDVFGPQADGTWGKSKFYTAAEKPAHMEEGSPYINAYQPVREEGEELESSYTTRTYINEHGKLISTSVCMETNDNDEKK